MRTGSACAKGSISPRCPVDLSPYQRQSKVSKARSVLTRATGTYSLSRQILAAASAAVSGRQETRKTAEQMESRIAGLTEGQRLCLMLVSEQRSSKEIARHLGISSHTVDQRMRAALKTLGVQQRAEAARLLQHALQREQQTRAALPFATRRHFRNTMSTTARLIWIAGIALAVPFLAGIGLAASESISNLIRR